MHPTDLRLGGRRTLGLPPYLNTPAGPHTPDGEVEEEVATEESTKSIHGSWLVQIGPKAQIIDPLPCRSRISLELRDIRRLSPSQLQAPVVKAATRSTIVGVPPTARGAAVVIPSSSFPPYFAKRGTTTVVGVSGGASQDPLEGEDGRRRRGSPPESLGREKPRRLGWEVQDDTTLVIRGCPIFSVSEVDGDEHVMNTAGIHDDEVDDNLYDANESLDRSLSPMQELSTLQDIRNFTHLRT
jgi:hypothetical protein